MKSNDAVLKLNTKPHSIYGIIAFIMAISSMGCVIASIAVSAFAVRNQQNMILVGSLEWIAATFSFAGLIVAIYGESTEDVEQIFSHIAIGLNVLGLLYHIMVFVIGF